MSKRNERLLCELRAAFEEACPGGWRIADVQVTGLFKDTGPTWTAWARVVSEPGRLSRHVWLKGTPRMGPEAVISESIRYLGLRGIRRITSSPILELELIARKRHVERSK